MKNFPDFDKLVGECTFTASLSGGPGGQHANKVETKVELRLNIKESKVLTDTQKHVLSGKTDQYIIDGGTTILIKSDKYRSRHQNKKAVIKKFELWLIGLLKPVKKRISTQMPEVAKEKRVKIKKRNAELKHGRGNLKGRIDFD